MQFDFEAIGMMERYRLLLATVLPRPIAWITSMDAAGTVNAAPFSFFNAFGPEPPVVGIGVGSHDAARPKDTRLNVRETGEFVVNLVGFGQVEAMATTSIAFAREDSEAEAAGLTLVPSSRVAPPRIGGAPVSFECKLLQEVPFGPTSLLLGRIVMAHVVDDAVSDLDRLRINADALDLVGRMEGHWYTRLGERFEIPVPSPGAWNGERLRIRKQPTDG